MLRSIGKQSGESVESVHAHVRAHVVNLQVILTGHAVSYRHDTYRSY